MAKNYVITDQLANIEANAAAVEFTNGYLRLYDASNNQLCEGRFGDPAFNSAISGVLVSTPIMADDDADATGAASKFKTFKADGTTQLSEGTIGITDDFDMKMNSINIQQNARVEFSSFKHTVVK